MELGSLRGHTVAELRSVAADAPPDNILQRILDQAQAITEVAGGVGFGACIDAIVLRLS